jgi:hypothetical protein
MSPTAKPEGPSLTPKFKGVYRIVDLISWQSPMMTRSVEQISEATSASETIWITELGKIKIWQRVEENMCEANLNAWEQIWTKAKGNSANSLSRQRFDGGLTATGHVPK